MIIGKLTNANIDIINSLIPKSITTPMGLSLTNTLSGIESITVVSIILTGILGAKGIALGTSAHALGTTKALEIGEVEGAMSSLSIGIAGIITVIVVPIILNLL